MFSCGGESDTAGDCSHTTYLGVLADETCICDTELCNSSNATLAGQKAMSGAGSTRPRPAVAIVAATVVAIAASIY